jgi:hypothetical protein
MALAPIYYYSASEGKYLEPATSSHPIEVEGYKIRPAFVSLVRKLDFARGSDEKSYKHLQDFEELCATLMIPGLNYETIKWKGTYPVHIGSPGTYRGHELTKFTKKSEKLYTCSFHPNPSVYKISTSNL